jgi:NDP-sugar pyrophosphorylase family protein
VLLDESGHVIGYSRRDAPGPSWHFVGVQVARRAAFADLDEGAAAASIGGVYDRLTRERPGSVRGWTTAASFLDVGTAETYLKSCLTLGPAVSIGQRCRVSPSSRLDRCVLWDDVTIDDDVTLTDCVVSDGVVLPRGSRYHRAVLLPAGKAPIGSMDRIEGELHIAPLEHPS